MTDTNENRVAHLQLIQGVINRLAGNSSLTKGWSVTLVSALFTVALLNNRPEIALVALFPALALWTLDAYYLRQERLFRNLYRAVHTAGFDAQGQPIFTMDARAYATPTDAYVLVSVRPPLSLFHGSIVIAIGVVSGMIYVLG